MSTELVNKQIDQYAYNQDEPIGSGQFATVFKGFHTVTQEPVAIKVITLRMIANEYLAKLLTNEIEVLRLLHSPNIVRFIDLKQTSHNIYLITEYCDGGDLANYLAKRGRLTESEVVPFLGQIVSAFKELKRMNVIHRDLKPANILLHKGNIKIADLGFARTVENFQASLLHSTVGSPIYMSPQVLIKKDYTSKCDIWSLGIILFQLLNGRVPWEALDMYSLAQAIKNEPLTFKSDVSISPAMKDFITNCLRYEERDRMSWDEASNHPILQSRAPIMKQLTMVITPTYERLSSDVQERISASTRQVTSGGFTPKDALSPTTVINPLIQTIPKIDLREDNQQFVQMQENQATPTTTYRQDIYTSERGWKPMGERSPLRMKSPDSAGRFQGEMLFVTGPTTTATTQQGPISNQKYVYYQEPSRTTQVVSPRNLGYAPSQKIYNLYYAPQQQQQYQVITTQVAQAQPGNYNFQPTNQTFTTYNTPTYQQ